jgi:hypothetical protein
LDALARHVPLDEAAQQAAAAVAAADPDSASSAPLRGKQY